MVFITIVTGAYKPTYNWDLSPGRVKGRHAKAQVVEETFGIEPTKQDT